ncbi:MAG: hypothetical protein NTV54_04125, partial [Ignavibacteriales bacterium]|nr:hypothetical protein [Ignavibacteriales bacterium]
NSGSSVATIRQKMESDVDPVTGRPTFTALTALCLMIYYMIALQCFSTMAVTRRETNGWKWPIIQLSYLSILAYVLTLAVHRISSIFIT